MHGYSSSEESEDPKRPRPLPASSSNSNDQKKRKKKKPPPQQAINRIWKKLQARKPTTPLAVLPFDPVPPPASPDRANEASDAGYQRAVDECRRKVRKIIKECRRVNMRYRDQGWDLVSSTPFFPLRPVFGGGGSGGLHLSVWRAGWGGNCPLRNQGRNRRCDRPSLGDSRSGGLDARKWDRVRTVPCLCSPPELALLTCDTVYRIGT